MIRPRLLVVAVIAPLVVTALAVIVGVVLAGDLSRSFVVHWNVVGEGDGFAPGWLLFVGMGALGVAIPLLVGLLLVGAGERGIGAQTKVLALVPLFIAGVLGGILLWIAASQQESAAGVPELWHGLLAGFVPGLLFAGVAWFVLPRVDADVAARAATPAPSIPLGADERAVWVGRTALVRSARVATGILVLVILAAMVAAIAVTGGALWGLLVVPAVLVVLFAATAAWTVRVDRDGLAVRSALGWPRFRIAPSEIVAVGVTTISPLAEYGGWGLRWAPGRRFGVVTRSGEALEVTVGGARRFVVTVDDAATAAGLLDALRYSDRSSTASSAGPAGTAP